MSGGDRSRHARGGRLVLLAAAAAAARIICVSGLVVVPVKKEAPRVAVVGAGVGGLALAGRLAAAGAQVRVFEKNGVSGGRVGEHRWQGHRWETGASLLLLPDVYRETFEALGDAAPFEPRRVRPSYGVWFSQEQHRGPVELGGNDRPALAARLELEAPGAIERFDSYMASAREYLRAGWPIFIEESTDGVVHLPRFLKNALSKVWRWPLFSHESALTRLFPDSPRLRALCSFNDLYVGLSPSKAPAVFGLLAAIELDDSSSVRPDAGVYYPIGGFGSLVERLERACVALGVQIEHDTPVSAITTEGRRATGVQRKDGTFYAADRVVLNADLTKAEPELLPKERSRSTYDDVEYSTSSVTFLWAFDRRLDTLRHHNVFLYESSDKQQDPFKPAWDFCFEGSEEIAAHFYVCAASRTDPSAAPEGRDSIMVLVPVPPLIEGAEYDVDALIPKLRTEVLRRFTEDAGCPADLTILHERVIEPREWRDRLGLRRGAVFGLSHGLDQLAVFRPARSSSTTDGLDFVGASTRPGNGVPLVLTSAKLLAADLERQLGLSSTRSMNS